MTTGFHAVRLGQVEIPRDLAFFPMLSMTCLTIFIPIELSRFPECTRALYCPSAQVGGVKP
jgi:hypothetical protein